MVDDLDVVSAILEPDTQQVTPILAVAHDGADGACEPTRPDGVQKVAPLRILPHLDVAVGRRILMPDRERVAVEA